MAEEDERESERIERLYERSRFTGYMYTQVSRSKGRAVMHVARLLHTVLGQGMNERRETFVPCLLG